MVMSPECLSMGHFQPSIKGLSFTLYINIKNNKQSGTQSLGATIIHALLWIDVNPASFEAETNPEKALNS